VQRIPEESQRFEPRSVAFALEQANDDGLYVQITGRYWFRMGGEDFHSTGLNRSANRAEQYWQS